MCSDTEDFPKEHFRIQTFHFIKKIYNPNSTPPGQLLYIKAITPIISKISKAHKTFFHTDLLTTCQATIALQIIQTKYKNNNTRTTIWNCFVFIFYNNSKIYNCYNLNFVSFLLLWFLISFKTFPSSNISLSLLLFTLLTLWYTLIVIILKY